LVSEDITDAITWNVVVVVLGKQVGHCTSEGINGVHKWRAWFVQEAGTICFILFI